MFDWSDLIEPARAVALVEPRGLDDETLLESAVAYERVRALVDAGEGRVLAEIDARNAADLHYGHRTPRWLAVETGVAPGVAKERLKVGAALRVHFPVMGEGLIEGAVSWDHARVLVGASNPRIVDQLTELEAELVDMAEGMIFERWRRHVQTVAHLLDQDGGYRPADDIDANKLHLRPTPDGIALSGTLFGATAAVSEQVINAVADELFRQYRADRDATDGEVRIPDRATLRALALAEICRRAMGVNTSEAPSGGRPKVEATLVVNAACPETCVHPSGFEWTDDTLAMLQCDMSLYAIVLNSLGVPLDMGREIRSANRAQRRGLTCRDGGCVFPGCGVHAEWTDAHHLRHWSKDLGTTDLAGMCLLCRHHHGVVHRRGWSISIDDQGWVHITTPSGRTLDGQRHGKVRAGP